ncbi:hypothetical protein [Endozoicomonas sp. ALC020]|uniref:hypothetical protein n=1 Tax=unclassified Endozoicomonas TaxID=2644528 RepID=UPI003BB1C8A1
MSLSDICQAEALIRSFIVELEQDANSLKQNFSVKRDRRKLSGIPSGIVVARGYDAALDLPDNKRQRLYSYRVKIPLVESISWHLLHATHLLVLYELIQTTRDTSQGLTLYSWLSMEAAVAVGWLLKSYWNPDSTLFNSLEQPSTSMLLKGSCPFSAITAMFGSEHNAPQHTPSETPGQQAPQTTTQPTGAPIRLVNSDSGGGNGGHQQHLHTLGLNCFIHPCHGVCQFQLLSNNTGLAEWPLKFGESSCPHLAYGHCMGCIGYFDSENVKYSLGNVPLETMNGLPDIKTQFIADQLFEPWAHGIDVNSIDGVTYKTETAGLFNHEDPVLGNAFSAAHDSVLFDRSVDLQIPHEETGFSMPFTHPETLQTTAASSQLDQGQHHRYRTVAIQATNNSSQTICYATVAGEGSQQRLPGKACKSALVLSNHISKYRTGVQICSETVIGTDGQQQPCGKIIKNYETLSDHIKRLHSGPQTCDLAFFGEHGLQRPCRSVCKNARAMSVHKSRYHSGQRTCAVIVVGKDSQVQPCGKVCNNAQALSDHKKRAHTKQQICDLVLPDGRQHLCGRAYKNSNALLDHKRKYHSGQKSCNLPLVGKDGQSRPCGKVCKNAQALIYHKKMHRMRKPVDVEQDADPRP